MAAIMQFEAQVVIKQLSNSESWIGVTEEHIHIKTFRTNA